MASYEDEHDTSRSEVQEFDLLDLLRYITQGGDDSIPEFERLAPPASKNAVENLPHRIVTDSREKCSVCMAVYRDTVIQMPCGHDFHKECLLPWLEKTNSCPLCRFELITDDLAYEERKKEKAMEQEREKRVEELHNSMFG